MHNHTEEKIHHITLAAVMNIGFTIIELVGGLWTNSLAIVSDSLHDFGDSIALTSSLLLEKNAQRKPDPKRTFGYQRLSLFSALLSAVILLSGSLFILSKAIPRLLHPESVNASGMVLLSVVGVIINGIAALRLYKGQSMNERVLTWHLLEDVLGWMVVLFGSLIMRFKAIYILDPLMTIGYTVFILWGVFKNSKEILNIFMQGVPMHINLEALKQGVLKLSGVIDVHDIHIWSMDGETDIFTGHFVVEDQLLRDSDQTRKMIKEELSKNHIEHSTIELETKHFCSGIECENYQK